MDLAEGHLAALDYAKARGPQGGNFVFNLGKRRGGGLGGVDCWMDVRADVGPSVSPPSCFPLHLIDTLHPTPLVGTGNGYSVLEMVSAMERASGRPIKSVIGERRPGDLDEVYSDPSKVSSVQSGRQAGRGLCVVGLRLCVGRRGFFFIFFWCVDARDHHTAPLPQKINQILTNPPFPSSPPTFSLLSLPAGGAGAGLEGHAEPGRHDARPLALAAEQPQRLPLSERGGAWV